MSFKLWSRRFMLLAAFTAMIGFVSIAYAFSAGRVGRSGNPATGGETCTQCHSGGIEPTVKLAGPAFIQPGETAAFSLLIFGGQETAGGFNVSATDGDLAILPGATDTQLKLESITNKNELTHTMRKDFDSAHQAVIFNFSWIAPAAESTATLYGAGNSVNGDGAFSGDGVNTDVFEIGITNAAQSLYLPAVVR